MPDLTRPDVEQLPPGQLGFVVTPPAGTGDHFTVTVPEFSGDHLYEITRWQSRGATLPAVGDEVLVVKDEKGEPWVAAFWPAAGDAPAVEVATSKGCVVEADEDPFAIGGAFTKPRPGGYPSVEWVCLLEPMNAINHDTWVNPGRP